MKNQFTRTKALFGEDAMARLKRSRVAVFGLGGVGGHCAEALCRSGVGEIDLYDGDIIDVTNINRQIIATHKTVDRVKAEVMKERLTEINPDAKIGAFRLFYLPDTADSVDLSAYDYIVDAVDTMSAKLTLAVRSSEHGVAIISSMGTANKLDPTALEVSDLYETTVCPMARIMRRELRKRGISSLKVVYSKEPPVKTSVPPDGSLEKRMGRRSVPASCAFVPAAAGLILAGEVVKDLIAGINR